MVKKVFSVITFALSLFFMMGLVILTVDMVKEYNQLSSSPYMSGSDYLGFLLYRIFYCIGSLPGIITSAISYKLSSNKAMKIISVVLLTVFIIVFAVFGMAWLNLIV